MGFVTRPEILQIQEEQGWSDETMAMLALRFVEGSQANFLAYLKEVQESENEGWDCLGSA